MSRLYGIINKLVSRGEYYSAAWTANSTSAYGTKLTGSITLPAGTYIIVCKTPYIASGTFPGFYLADSGGIVDSTTISAPAGQQSETMLMEFAEQKTVWLESSGSPACNFSVIERGSLRAIRIR